MSNSIKQITNKGISIEETKDKTPYRFNMDKFNDMLTKNMSFDEVVDYCKSTFSNTFNYCSNCDAFLSIEDRIGSTNFVVCNKCKFVNDLKGGDI